MVMKEILEMTVGCLFLIFTMVSTIQMMKKPNVCVHTVHTSMYVYDTITHASCTQMVYLIMCIPEPTHCP